jgi:rhamnosyltransferase subunit B
MARILIGWELGAHRGHVEAIRLIAAALLAAGHEVSIALQQLDALGLERDLRLTLWQAPLWPRLLANRAGSHQRPVATMGDILARLGLDTPGVFAALVGGWDAIFAHAKPDVVIADFAPALLTAARGRIRSINTGNPFTCPPDQAERFPSLANCMTAYDEAALLDTVDADLHALGRPPLGSLPGLFTADRTLIAGFEELDPYRAESRTYCAPAVVPPLPQTIGGLGEELFVYGFNRFAPDHPLWAALALVQRPVRLYMAEPEPGHLAFFNRAKFKLEPHPLPFTKIAERSAATVSYGGHGFLSANLLAGLPQMIVSFDLEKRLNGTRLAALGLGDHVDQGELEPQALAARIDAVADDTVLAQCLKAAAPSFRARMTVSLASEVLRAVEAR